MPLPLAQEYSLLLVGHLPLSQQASARLTGSVSNKSESGMKKKRGTISTSHWPITKYRSYELRRT